MNIPNELSGHLFTINNHFHHIKSLGMDMPSFRKYLKECNEEIMGYSLTPYLPRKGCAGIMVKNKITSREGWFHIKWPDFLALFTGMCVFPHCRYQFVHFSRCMDCAEKWDDIGPARIMFCAGYCPDMLELREAIEEGPLSKDKTMDSSSAYQIIIVDHKGNEYPSFFYYASVISIPLAFATLFYNREHRIETEDGYKVIKIRCIKITTAHWKFRRSEGFKPIDKPKVVAVINTLDDSAKSKFDLLDLLPF